MRRLKGSITPGFKSLVGSDRLQWLLPLFCGYPSASCPFEGGGWGGEGNPPRESGFFSSLYRSKPSALRSQVRPSCVGEGRDGTKLSTRELQRHPFIPSGAGRDVARGAGLKFAACPGIWREQE